MRLLVVEDEKRIAQALRAGLEDEGCAVDVEHDGEDGLNAALAFEYDAILLDVMLPSLDGFEVCRRLRAESRHTPVIMLTARDREQDIVNGLDSGADDYLPKPFAFEVLLARVRALLRRPSESLSDELVVGDLTIETKDKKVTRGKKSIKLSVKEYAILEYMARNAQKTVSKEQIIEHVWDFDADVLPNTVEVFVTFLRSKIDKPFKKPLIHTVRGFGYVLSEDKP